VSENKYILKLKELIIDFLKYDNVKVVLFGSRARGDMKNLLKIKSLFSERMWKT